MSKMLKKIILIYFEKDYGFDLVDSGPLHYKNN